MPVLMKMKLYNQQNQNQLNQLNQLNQQQLNQQNHLQNSQHTIKLGATNRRKCSLLFIQGNKHCGSCGK